ncbi:hypothetical protein P7H15_15565 [Paenibacillus larvae]|nr:hypothetical protein [Paenibacillus larvae]MDT2293945.1 hypothetical protein [Paenibacillus larvae]
METGMLEVGTTGRKRLNTEYQNNPIDEESAIFVPGKVPLLRRIRHLRPVRTHDPDGPYTHFGTLHKARTGRSDYNAYPLRLRRCRRTGVLYVLDAWAQKCQAHVAPKVAAEKIIEYEHRVFAVETVGAQFDMYRQLQEELSRRKIYRTRIKSFSSKTKKEELVESLEPLIESGFLRFSRSHRLLLEQMEQFPGGTIMTTCRTHWPEPSTLRRKKDDVRNRIHENQQDYEEVNEAERYICCRRVFSDVEQKRHKKRIERYKENQKLFKGAHYDVFERVHQRAYLTLQRDTVYIAANFPGLICKSQRIFLFGETPTFSAGNGKDHSPEQETIERLSNKPAAHHQL